MAKAGYTAKAKHNEGCNPILASIEAAENLEAEINQEIFQLINGPQCGKYQYQDRALYGQ